jgi:histidine triad (HIT) family protein
MTKQQGPALDALKKASKGLVFPSETDAPLEPFAWKAAGELTSENLLKLAGADPSTPVETATLDSFFRVVPKEDRASFDKLAKVLQEQLSGVKVYKLGADPEKQVYVVGKTADGQWAGLMTTVVET